MKKFVKRKPRIDISGKRFGKLSVIKYIGSYDHSTYWECKCDCGNVHNVRYSHLSNGQIKSCGCMKNKSGAAHHKWAGYQQITGTYMRQLKTGAKTRGLDFDVSIEYLWKLFVAQNKKCALSGLELTMDYSSTKIRKSGSCENTASLDRIDSNIGYIEGNVQWVHKDINMMKRTYDENYFIKMCKLVANNRN